MKKGIPPLPKEVPSAETPQAKAELTFFGSIEKGVQVWGSWQDITERKKYAGRAYGLIACWLFGVFTILILNGIGLIGLSESVILALLGGTTIKVVGVFYFVMKYLFDPKRGP